MEVTDHRRLGKKLATALTPLTFQTQFHPCHSVPSVVLHPPLFQSGCTLQKDKPASGVIRFGSWDMPELEAVQRTANRVRDMWEASGRQPIGLMAFSDAVGSHNSCGSRMLKVAIDEGLVKKAGRGKGYFPILPEAN